MARYTGPSCRLCRRENMELFLKGERCYTDKCGIKRRSYPPGQHGQGRSKTSAYGVQLREKQKVRRIYGLLEKQFRGYFAEADRMKGVTGENLLSLLERRLDNTVYRLGFASSRTESRQLVRHGHFSLNGRKVNIPSIQLKSGDVIELREKSRKIVTVNDSLEAVVRRGIPQWLELDRDAFKGVLKGLPAREDITTPIQEQLIVELYSKEIIGITVYSTVTLTTGQYSPEEVVMYKNWRDLIKPKQLQVEKESLSATYGKFFAEPFERGFGTTLGNSLRRILLSSLQGAAITAVRIKGVLHEFSTIQGVTEDVTDIILNLKGVRLKLHSSDGAIIHIKHKGEGLICAGDLLVGHNVEVMNPEHHIATCGKDASFEVELTVRMGKGYVTADRNRDEKAPVGTIPIDSIFTPIKKVNFAVSNARVGQMTDYDKLTVEVWTDGSAKPEDAVAYAAKIMKEQLTIFINFDEESEPQLLEESQEEKDKVNENLYRTVEELELSVRSANCLKNAGIKLIGELVSKTEAEMLKTQNFGRKSLNEIKDILNDMGLTFGMKIDGFPDPEFLRRLRGEQKKEE